MNLLLLAGNGQHNKEWIYKVKDVLSPLFATLHVHEYAHWDSDEAFIDFDKEYATVEEETTKLGQYVIFAKSVGTILTLKGINEGVLHPTKCIFVGLPLTMTAEENSKIKAWLQASNVPILFVQNTDDPLGSFDQVKAFVKSTGVVNCHIVNLPGDSHSYDDFQKLRALIESFLES